MITIVESQERVAKLWGKQAIKPEETYRLMKYVLRVEHEGHTALHNVMTGQLILLNDEEIRLLDALPAKYSPEMDALAADHYLVPEGYDEYKQLKSLRTILRKLTPPIDGIIHFNIFPTTACNARCYYCFEQGAEIVTMTEQTAEDTVRFIADNCPADKKVYITWFGGEPTVAAHRIDQICRGLQREGVDYTTSLLYTNGYLFDEEMADKARDLWRVQKTQIVIDGTEGLYNRIKNYVNPQDNPYQRVMRNIGLLLDRGIRVVVRMNVDLINRDSFEPVAKELITRFPDKKKLSFWARPVIGDYSKGDPEKAHADEAWLENCASLLNNVSESYGLATYTLALPAMNTHSCMSGCNNGIVITPSGALVKCPEHFTKADEVGNLIEGLTNNDRIASWHEIAYAKMCEECAFAPECVRLTLCSGTERCGRAKLNKRFIRAIHKTISAFINERRNNNGI